MNIIQGLLEKLCCKHKWYFLDDAVHFDDFGFSHTKKTLICKNCGKIKQIIL